MFCAATAVCSHLAWDPTACEYYQYCLTNMTIISQTCHKLLISNPKHHHHLGIQELPYQAAPPPHTQKLSDLEHPNIIRYKESYTDDKDGSLNIVTSFCEEGDLFGKIQQRANNKTMFSEEEVMDMFIMVGAGRWRFRGGGGAYITRPACSACMFRGVMD